jgi:hypothetical protein
VRDKKATGEVLGLDVLTLFGEDGLRIKTKLISNMFETGDLPKGLTEVTMLVL